MRSVLLVIGTRPEAIKMAPVLLALRKTACSAQLLHSGQHETMADEALSAFGILPDLRLPSPPSLRTHSELTAHLLSHLSDAFRRERPSMILVHGDTATAYAAALAAFYQRIPVAHVEAGLRSGDLYAPFPEEYNRRAIAVSASIHFAPTEAAKQNLLREGIGEETIFAVGNTAIDALQYTVKNDFDHPFLRASEGGQRILFTAHRRENQGAPMVGMLRALRRLVDAAWDRWAILPMHPSPILRQQIHEELDDHPRILLTEPLDVVSCHNLLARSTLVMTDSGGIQEEAAALGIPTVVMRSRTERSEGLCQNGGCLLLAGQKEEEIYRAASRLLSDPHAYKKAAKVCSAFGDGHAADRIASILSEQMQIPPRF